jgi:hypothetical protein
LNAVTELVDHERGRSNNTRIESAWFGTGAALKARAVDLLAARIIGTVRERDTGQHWIGLDLMQSGRADGWGYKDQDESVGPCAVDCPLAYLDAPHAEREGWAAQWRERVRAHHAARKAKPAPVAGAWVQLSGQAYRLIEPAGPRRGWRVSDEIGRTYRMQARQLARAEPCENPSQARQAMAA